MRRAKGSLGHQPGFGIQHAGDGMDFGRLQRLFKIERSQDSRQPLGQHGFAGTGRPDHQNVVAAGSGDFQRALCGLLSAHIAKVERKMLHLAEEFAGGHANRLRVDAAVSSRVEKLSNLQQRVHAVDVDALDHRRFAGIRRRDQQILDAAFPRCDGNGQHPLDWPQATVEAQFSYQEKIAEVAQLQAAIRTQNPDCHGQIEAGAFFLQIGGRQVNGDLRRRNIEAGIFDGGADAVAALAHGGVGQTDRMKAVFCRLDAGKIHFNIDDVGVDTIYSGAKGFEKHRGGIRLLIVGKVTVALLLLLELTNDMAKKKLSSSLMCFVVAIFFSPMIAQALKGMAAPAGQSPSQQAPPKPLFKFQQVMVPMRDGVHLQTVILTPIDQKGPLPILLQRTPYGVPAKAPTEIPPSMKELAKDGYIFVIQNLRGRFQSEGVFKLSSYVDLNDPKATNETTDAYDTIGWLVKNIPNNNGRVGIFGVSYVGLTAGMTLLHPNPALKAVSEQAAPVDQWMNDDMHRYGALRESYAIEYSVMEQASKTENTHFDFNTYDTYQWYLDLGPLTNENAEYIQGAIPFWNSIMEHPNYDAFWKKEAWVNQLHASTVPNLNVAGFWDQEDPWGPWQIFRHAKEHDPDQTDFIVAGPWFHGQWQTARADSVGLIPFGGHDGP